MFSSGVSVVLISFLTRMAFEAGPRHRTALRAFSARANFAADTIFIDEVILEMLRIDLRLMSTKRAWEGVGEGWLAWGHRSKCRPAGIYQPA